MTNKAVPNERVTVQLKPLINLASKASLLTIRGGRIKANQSGGYASRFKGRGMEFDEVRQYQAGDDIRSIDWRVTARTNKTHSKVFHEERERPVFISVDARAAMQFATQGVFKSVQAANIAALIAWAAQSNGDKVGGQVFAQHGCQEIKPAAGRASVLHFLNALVQPALMKAEDICLDDVLQRLSQHARPGSLVYIISDFRGLNDNVERQLAKLSRHCDVVLLHVFDELERTLPTKGRYRFTNGGQDTVVDMSDKQRVKQYEQHFIEREARLQKLCKTWRMALVQCSTVDDPLKVLS